MEDTARFTLTWKEFWKKFLQIGSYYITGIVGLILVFQGIRLLHMTQVWQDTNIHTVWAIAMFIAIALIMRNSFHRVDSDKKRKLSLYPVMIFTLVGFWDSTHMMLKHLKVLYHAI